MIIQVNVLQIKQGREATWNIKSYRVDVDRIKVPAVKRLVNRGNATKQIILVSEKYKAGKGYKSIYNILRTASIDERLPALVEGSIRFDLR